jgi:hypothetical protein
MCLSRGNTHCPVMPPLQFSLARNKMLFATLSTGTGFFKAVLLHIRIVIQISTILT